MSNVRGKISIDVQFADSTAASGVQSLKTITQQDVKEYTTGKVAIVSGTVGTAAVTLWTVGADGLANLYKNSSGQAVGLLVPVRVAVLGSQNGVFVRETDVLNTDVAYSQGDVAVGSVAGGSSGEIRGGSGTASFTVVLYGT